MEEETPRQSRSPRDASQPHGGQTKSVILPQRPLVAVITHRTFEKKKKKIVRIAKFIQFKLYRGET